MCEGGSKELVCLQAHRITGAMLMLFFRSSVRPGLGQSPCCRAQLQLSAHSTAGVSQPAVPDPGLLYGNSKLTMMMMMMMMTKIIWLHGIKKLL